MTLEKKLKQTIYSNDINLIHEVFDEIYSTYGRLVYFKIAQYINNQQDIEELTQDVFISFYNSCFKTSINNIKYYLMQSAKNKSLDYIKSKKENIILDENKIYEEKDYIDVNYEEVIEKMKLFLNDDEIEIILKHNIDGYTFKELSLELNKSINTIISIYNRSIKKFKKGVKKYEETK